MNDTVELWTLRDENADLRRQLGERSIGGDVAQLTQELAEAQRQLADITKRTIDDYERMVKVVSAHGLMHDDTVGQVIELLSEAQRQRDEEKAANAAMRCHLERYCDPKGLCGEAEQYSYEDVLASDAGRDFLARLEAAQRTIQAADGLYKVLMECSDDLRSDPDIAAALAAYEATKEQK